MAREFFHKSVGTWNSQRRFYILKSDVAAREVLSIITVECLEQGCAKPIKLAKDQSLEDKTVLSFGSYVTWESSYTGTSRKPSKGSTIFGGLGKILYRDHGLTTKGPLQAIYSLPNPQILCLRT